MNAAIEETTDEQRRTLNGQPIPPEPDSDNPALIRADIAATRSQLGDTVEALAAKMDVKSQLRTRARQTGDVMRRQWVPLSMIAAAAILVGVGLAIRRRGDDDVRQRRAVWHDRRQDWRARRQAWRSMRQEQFAAWQAMRADGRRRMRDMGRKSRR